MAGLHEFDIGVSSHFVGGRILHSQARWTSTTGVSIANEKKNETPSSISWSERPMATEREIEVHTRSGRVTSSAGILRGIGRHLEPPVFSLTRNLESSDINSVCPLFAIYFLVYQDVGKTIILHPPVDGRQATGQI